MLLPALISARLGVLCDRARRRSLDQAVIRVRFLVSALDQARDFSGIHEFPARIEQLVIQVLEIDPLNTYALSIESRLQELRTLAANVAAMRRPPP